MSPVGLPAPDQTFGSVSAPTRAFLGHFLASHQHHGGQLHIILHFQDAEDAPFWKPTPNTPRWHHGALGPVAIPTGTKKARKAPSLFFVIIFISPSLFFFVFFPPGLKTREKRQNMVVRGVPHCVLRGTREGNLPPLRLTIFSAAALSSVVPMKDPRRCFLQRSASLTSPSLKLSMKEFINFFALTDMRPATGGTRPAGPESHLQLDFFFNWELSPFGTGFQLPDLLCLMGGFICWAFCFLLLLLLFLGGCPRCLVAAAMGCPSASVVPAARGSRSFFRGGYRQMRARHHSWLGETGLL